VPGIKKKRKKAEAPLAAMTGPPTPAVLAPKEKRRHGDGPVPEEYVKQVIQAEDLAPAFSEHHRDSEERASKPSSLHPLGAVALFLGSLGLLFAEFPLLRFLTLPLAGAGLLLGLIALMVSLDAGIKRWLLPATGSVISLAVILVVCFWPLLLGIEPSQASAEEDPDKQVVITVTGNRATMRDADSSEWVDVSQHYLQHGRVRVRVTGAEIKRVQFKDPRSKASADGEKLVLTLRLINVQGADKIDYKGWQAASKLQLEDNQGKIYPQPNFGSGGEVVGQVETAALYPGKEIRDVLIFEAPRGRVEYLKLELPAFVFGRKGSLRLKIPGTMIRRP
jgi:hypothetical protein